MSAVSDSIEAEGFAIVPAAQTRALLGGLPDWDLFADSWNDLGVDGFMADGGRYRRRRFAAFAASADGTITRKPHQPHYQSRDYNNLQGGIERWFAPVLPDVANSSSLHVILHFCRAFFGALSPEVPSWHIELHQFRIEARPGEPGQPTPEGVHRDGVDYVLVLLVDRLNIASGTTTIHAAGGELLGSFTLTHSLDAALVDDSRVFHGVTPVEPEDPAEASHRDVLVVTFRRVV